jgi:hypothetical protein
MGEVWPTVPAASDAQLREGRRGAFTGEWGQVLSREIGLIPRCDRVPLQRRQYRPMTLACMSRTSRSRRHPRPYLDPFAPRLRLGSVTTPHLAATIPNRQENV